MDELAKTVQQKYIEDLTAKYPLHRFLILFMVIFFMLTYLSGNTDLYTIVDSVKITDVFDFQNGIISELSILQLIKALLIAYLFNLCHSKSNILFFRTLTQMFNFNDYVLSITEKYKKSRRGDAYDFFLVRELDKKIVEKRTALRIKIVNSEMLFSFGLCVAWSFLLSTWNILAFVFLFSFWFYNQWCIFKFYLKDFFPLYVAKKFLMSEEISFEEGYMD